MAVQERTRVRPLVRQCQSSRDSEIRWCPSRKTGQEGGWEQFQDDLELGWGSIEKVALPKQVHRIGLRYINRIERESSNQSLSEWLTESDYFPKSILQMSSRFMARTEFYPQSDLKLIVTVGEGRNESLATPIRPDLEKELKDASIKLRKG